MPLPTFWHRATFSVVEVADLIGVPEDTLRTWLMRTPMNDFLGVRDGGRVWLSGQDAFFYLLVKHLSAGGVPVRTAMYAAAGYANDLEDSLPDEMLVVRTAGGKTTFELTFAPDLSKPALVLPLHELASDLIDRAARFYVEAR